MKKVILVFLVAVCAATFSACSNSSSKSLAFVSDSAVVAKPKTPALDPYEVVVAKNTAISKSKEIPVGDTTFKKLVSYIQKHGFSIYRGTGHQVTFYDSKGNRHGFLAYPTDDKKEVTRIEVYAYAKGIQDQKHFIPYDITAKTVKAFTLGVYGVWEGAEDDLLGYKEFLAKVNK